MRRRLWKLLTQLYPAWLRWRYGMHIGRNCHISWKAHLDKSVNPQGIYIGDNTWILSGAVILAHDYCRNLRTDTRIGSDCVIGIRSIIMPGIRVENQSVIGAGSVVTKNIPAQVIAAGNQARIIRKGICVRNGQIIQ